MQRYVVLLLSLLVCGHLRAQSNFGSIRGMVSDASGAAVPGAVVTITDLGTNAKINLVSAGDGGYSSPPLRPVIFRVSAEFKGFQKTIVNDVKVDTANVTTVNISLKTGDVATSIEVTGAAPLVQTSSGALQQTVNQRAINDLPLNGRNTLALALTLPGVAGSAGTEISEFTTNEPVPCNSLLPDLVVC